MEDDVIFRGATEEYNFPQTRSQMPQWTLDFHAMLAQYFTDELYLPCWKLDVYGTDCNCVKSNPHAEHTIAEAQPSFHGTLAFRRYTQQ